MSKFDPYEHLQIDLNPDGSITRLMELPDVDPNPEPVPGKHTVSKDIIINSETNVFARIYRPTRLPSNDTTVARLPILLYFHDGGFIFGRASNMQTDKACYEFSGEIPSIVVSVDYRLAPENRLPAQYEDAVDAILWVKKQVMDTTGEQWLKDYGDFTRCYLGGRGSGANIAFHAALRCSALDPKPIEITGVFMNQPMFGGKQRKQSELTFATNQLLPLPVLDLLWELALPKGTDRDHRFSNPMSDGPYRRKIGSILRRCLVIGYALDPMIDRQQEFVNMLVRTGVQVEAHFDDLGFHNVDMVDINRAQAILNIIKEFII
ncbi:hypothetical protein SLA2020_136810 [Shorea laevis]